MDDCDIDYTLPEHPDAAKARLEANGEWVSAKNILGNKRVLYRRLHAREPRGFKFRLETEKFAWDHFFDKYPAPADAVPLLSLAEYVAKKLPASGKGMPGLTPKAEKRFAEIGDTTEALAEVNWVYHHIDDDPPDPFMCPSRGAWSLLKEAKQNGRTWFLEKMFKPLVGEMSKKKTETADSAVSKQEKVCREELKVMLERARERCLEQSKS